MARFDVPSAASSPTSSRTSSRSLRAPTPPRILTPQLRTVFARGVLKKRGRLGRLQGKSSLTLLNEFPGKKPRLSTNSPQSPSFDRHQTAVWWQQRKQSTEEVQICRDVANDEGVSPEAVEDVRLVLDHPNLVRLLDHSGFRIDDTRSETSWEFCDAGSLNQLMLDQSSGQGLPESLIWHTALSLLRAMHYLNCGTYPDQEDSVPGWRAIVHNGINPANIFYCHPRNRSKCKKPTYGTCKLGNFARCTILRHPLERYSVLQCEKAGIADETSGYEAPEITNLIGDSEIYVDTSGPALESIGETSTIGSAGDIWSIGAVAIAMMTGKPLWDHVMRENISASMMSRRYEAWEKVWPPDRYARLEALLERDGLWKSLPLWYSTELKKFVQSLVSLVPEERCDVEDMLERAEYMYWKKRQAVVGTEEEGEYME